MDNNKTVCAYCGKEKEGLSFFIGASNEPAWTMIEGTGKMTCPAPECFKKAVNEGQSVIKKLTEAKI